MNIPMDNEKLITCANELKALFQDEEDGMLDALYSAYRKGHRDALHAAAELVDVQREKLERSTHANDPSDPMPEVDNRHQKAIERLNDENSWEEKELREEIIAKYEDPLRSYEAEVGVKRGTLTLSKLIDMHRNVWRRSTQERFIPIERLRKMTIDEICALVSSSDPEEEGNP